MKTRLNHILTTLSQQYAYTSLQDAPQDETRLRYLADCLASKGFLVIVADIPVNNFDMMLKTWIDSYNRFYTLMSRTLFPMYSSVNIAVVDGMRPPVVLIHGESPAIIKTIADYLVPYVALRHSTNAVSDAEIIGVMTYILNALEATDLPHHTYEAVRGQATQIVSQMMTLPVQQFSLTVMKKPLFQNNHVQPTMLPSQKVRPAPPKSLPETGKLNPDALNRKRVREQQQDKHTTQSIPIWWNTDDDPDSTQSYPPVQDDDKS